MARIMIVDDAAFMRAILSQMLRENGYEIAAEAASGEEAIQLYRERRPDLVTMDITMPDMDGITAMRHIRQFDPAAKIIICSAMSHQQAVIDSIANGARDFIAKPLQKERVYSAIERVLAEAGTAPIIKPV
ncbi:response regulator [Paenibacillus sp. HJGM_3]|uniref:response regulator n=1 Tax=Paenibacillus sp. HJGM_3 TaxID=3379816 RepID=UPI00385E9A39